MRSVPIRTARSRAIAGALLIAIPTAVVAPAVGAANSQGAQVTIAPGVRSLQEGQRLLVRANVSSAQPGLTAWLEIQSAGASWQPIATATVDGSGRAVLTARPEHSGLLRVVVGNAGAPIGATTTATGGIAQSARATLAVPATPVAISPTRRLAVAARLVLGSRRLQVIGGQNAFVRGTLRPAVAGRTVVLQARGRRAWHAIARARTSRGGRYTLVVHTSSPDFRPLRVRFPGDGQNAETTHRLAPLEVFQASLASEYGNGDGTMGSALACGGTLQPDTLGVANVTLPCGTMVTFRYGGREIRVPVIDRGPYVGGRTWDLTVATADRLGFSGAGTVLATS
ncbi:MAG: RlpA-like double-psi beta-barrel domain-containing protein [Solirubrobacteraceae bacterium]